MTFRTSVISMVTQTHPNRFQPFGYFKSKAYKPNLVSVADMRNTVKSLNAIYDFLLRSSFCNAKKSMLKLPKFCPYNRNIDILYVRFWYIILFSWPQLHVILRIQGSIILSYGFLNKIFRII